MVEQRQKRDLLTDARTVYIGDDTGLVKKVRIVAKRIEETQTISYDQGMPTRRRRIDENGNEVPIFRRNGVLTAADNQKYTKHETDFQFKLLSKFGTQEKNQGVSCLGWISENSLLSYVRGSENIVQVFDTKAETVLKQRQYKTENDPIVGLHSLSQENFKHAIINRKAQLTIDDLAKKEGSAIKLQLLGSHIHKTYLKDEKILALSKGQTLQVWDINVSKQIYLAKNVRNDELDLQVPIFDTGLTFLDSSRDVVAVCTGYGAIRTYDFRVGKKARSAIDILQNEMMITHIIQSQANPNNLYIINQEGSPLVLDRRFNCRVIRKMPGSKGTVRDCAIIGSYQDREFLVTVGCDRYLRVFDASKELQSDTCCGSAYLKQKLNTLLLSPKQ